MKKWFRTESENYYFVIICGYIFCLYSSWRWRRRQQTNKLVIWPSVLLILSVWLYCNLPLFLYVLFTPRSTYLTTHLHTYSLRIYLPIYLPTYLYVVQVILNLCLLFNYIRLSFLFQLISYLGSCLYHLASFVLFRFYLFCTINNTTN